MFLHGSGASERGGFGYALSTNDHPAGNMLSNMRKVPTGTVTVIGLEKKKVSYILLLYANYITPFILLLFLVVGPKRNSVRSMHREERNV